MIHNKIIKFNLNIFKLSKYFLSSWWAGGCWGVNEWFWVRSDNDFDDDVMTEQNKIFFYQLLNQLENTFDCNLY